MATTTATDRKAADAKAKADDKANDNAAKIAEDSQVDPLIETDGITPAEADRTNPPLTDAEAIAQAGNNIPGRLEPIAAPNYDDVDVRSKADFKRVAEDVVNSFARGLLVKELRREDTSLRQQIGYALGYDVTGVHQVRLEVVETTGKDGAKDGGVEIKARHRADGEWITLNVD